MIIATVGAASGWREKAVTTMQDEVVWLIGQQ